MITRQDKQRARDAVRRALRTGRLVRGECEFKSIDCSGSIEAHHDNYRRPLKVRWICIRHHRKLDGPSMRRVYTNNGMRKKMERGQPRQITESTTANRHETVTETGRPVRNVPHLFVTRAVSIT